MILTDYHIKSLIGERKRDCNKGDFGKGLLMAGSAGFTGAAIMCAASALRAGIGTLKVMCPEPVQAAFFALPEAMTVGFSGDSWNTSDIKAIKNMLSHSTCAAVGPGMGVSGGAYEAVAAVMDSGMPCVIDADALNSIARYAHGVTLCAQNAVLTPHPGEMSRLTGLTVDEITSAPERIASEYAKKWGVNVLLKGADTFIASPDGRTAKSDTGNPGLAKGGSGDVLTGIILGLMGQKLTAFDAACAGAYIMGISADKAMELLKERMLMARDVIDTIDLTLDEFCAGHNE